MRGADGGTPSARSSFAQISGVNGTSTPTSSSGTSASSAAGSSPARKAAGSTAFEIAGQAITSTMVMTTNHQLLIAPVSART